jgi:hypothetical protein
VKSVEIYRSFGGAYCLHHQGDELLVTGNVQVLTSGKASVNYSVRISAATTNISWFFNDCLFDIYAAALHTWRPLQPATQDATCRGEFHVKRLHQTVTSQHETGFVTTLKV